MGKVLVLYDSASGNTAKMAALVAAGAADIPGTEVRCAPRGRSHPRGRLLAPNGFSGSNA